MYTHKHLRKEEGWEEAPNPTLANMQQLFPMNCYWRDDDATKFGLLSPTGQTSMPKGQGSQCLVGFPVSKSNAIILLLTLIYHIYLATVTSFK
jgi:hypothetical protein